MMPEELLIRELSDKAFANHTITERLRDGVFRSWRCSKPDSWNYGFDITTTPGSLIITGDIGDAVFTREIDMLPWACKSVDDIYYFSGKMVAGPEKLEWDDDKLKAAIQAIIDSKDEGLSFSEVQELKYLLDQVGHNSPQWIADELYNLGVIPDGLPNCKVYGNGLLWIRDAVRWFCRHHKEPMPEDAS